LDYLKVKIAGVTLAIILIVAILTTALPATGLFAATQATGETIKVRMGMTPLLHGLPMYLAIEKGYFTEAGIELELTKYEAPNQLIDAVMQDKLDFTSVGGPAGIAGIANYKNPGKVMLYNVSGGDLVNPADFLLLPIDSNITKISELKGKKLGILGGSIQWRVLATELLAQNGLVIDKNVTLIELAAATQVPTLKAKQIDALLTLEPMKTIAIKSGAGKVFENGPMEKILSNPFWPGGGVVSVKFAKENPNTTRKVLEVLDKAIMEVESDFNGSKKYLKGYTPLDDSTTQGLTMPVLKTCNNMTAGDVESLQKFFDLFEKYNIVDGRMDANAFLYCNRDAS